MKDNFTLQEIADWQLDSSNSQVELPSIQRGFVWKPKQVEDLWDSILRGFPIGSFLFSKSGEKLYLMDGQQRSTSIFLGHFNPYILNNNIKTWAIKNELPVLWIDIEPEEVLPNSSKYLFRLVTHSHPWGYQAMNNDTKLTVSDRRKALELFKKNPDNKNKGYTSFRNSNVFPYDCNYPIPFCFFIESNDVKEVISKCEKYLPNDISTKRGNFKDKAEFLKLLSGELYTELKDIFSKVKNVKSKTIIKSNIIEDDVLNEENDTKNPTLFVRMNSSGTALTGDDLIYSIYKSVFPEAKDLIEKIGIGFISPTQTLSLVSRIVSSDLQNNQFTKKMNVNDFQRKIKNDEFKDKLKDLILSEKIKELFEKSISILSCKDNTLPIREIPPIIIKQLIKKNQDLYLFFLYWLYKNSDVDLDNDLKLKMTAKFISFAWFDFANLPRLWEEKVLSKDFWKEPLNDFMWWNDSDGIHFLLPPDLLKNYYNQKNVIIKFKNNDSNKWNLQEEGIGEKIISYYKFVKNKKFEINDSNKFFQGFINKIQHNRQMILFAQREYINTEFSDFNQLDELEDTNTPWDWDHIYPSEWVYNMKKCNQGIRDWNNTNGNLRAISLEHNRSRGNNQAPKDISDTEEQKFSFIKENDWEYWKNIDSRIWNDEIDNHFNAITNRMINIYEKFWKDLKINDFVKQPNV